MDLQWFVEEVEAMIAHNHVENKIETNGEERTTNETETYETETYESIIENGIENLELSDDETAPKTRSKWTSDGPIKFAKSADVSAEILPEIESDIIPEPPVITAFEITNTPPNKVSTSTKSPILRTKTVTKKAARPHTVHLGGGGDSTNSTLGNPVMKKRTLSDSTEQDENKPPVSAFWER